MSLENIRKNVPPSQPYSLLLCYEIKKRNTERNPKQSFSINQLDAIVFVQNPVAKKDFIERITEQ